MDENRKRAYLFLIYRSLIEIRSGHYRPHQWWNPREWHQFLREVKRKMFLADAFHNLALSSSRGFEGFREDQFWLGMERYAELYPRACEFVNYQQLFEERLADENKTW